MNIIQIKAKAEPEENSHQFKTLQNQMTKVNKDRDRLLTLRMHDEITAETYANKDQELRNVLYRLKTQLDGLEQQKSELGEVAIKVLELSQHPGEKWLTADIPEKRRILEIVCLNLTFKDASLDVTMRKPFDVIAEGLNLKIGAEERT